MNDDTPRGVPEDGGPADGVPAAESPGGPARGGPPVPTVDARGRRCPIPVIELARRIGDVDPGGTVELLADDPAAALDVAAWCRMRGQTLLETRDLPDAATAYLVRRNA